MRIPTCRRSDFAVFLALCLFSSAVVLKASEDRVDTIKLDWAYYNPVSLVLKEKGLLEEEFKKDGIKIEWAQSLGSNMRQQLSIRRYFPTAMRL